VASVGFGVKPQKRVKGETLIEFETKSQGVGSQQGKWEKF